MAQLMPLPLTVSYFSKIQIGFTFLVPAHPGSPRQRAVKRACVTPVCMYIRGTNPDTVCIQLCEMRKPVFVHTVVGTEFYAKKSVNSAAFLSLIALLSSIWLPVLQINRCNCTIRILFVVVDLKIWFWFKLLVCCWCFTVEETLLLL